MADLNQIKLKTTGTDQNDLLVGMLMDHITHEPSLTAATDGSMLLRENYKLT